MKRFLRTPPHPPVTATILLGGLLCLAAAARPTMNVVRVEILAPERGSAFQIFHDVGHGFIQKHSSSLDYPRGDRLQTIFLERPAGKVRAVRLDPLSGPGEVRIKSIADGHRPILGLGPTRIARVWSAEEILDSFGAMPQGAAISLENGMATIRSTGSDPRLVGSSGTEVPGGSDAAAFDVTSRLQIKLLDGLILLLLASCIGLAGLLLGRSRLALQAARLQAHSVFVGLALPFGLFFVLLTPPLQAPDEQVHLFRSYQIASLDVFKPDDTVPVGLIHLLYRYQPLMFGPEARTSAHEILASLSLRIDPSATTKHSTPDLVLPYLPQALGVLCGKAVSRSPLVMLFLGRVFNLVAFILLVYAAIRTAPVFKWTLLLIALMPICAFLAGSLSYDASTIGVVFLFFATVLKFSLAEGPPLDPARLRLLFLLAWATALVKPPYCLAVVSVLLLPVRKLGSAKRYWLVFAVLVCSTLLMTQAWTLARAAATALGLIHPDAAALVATQTRDQLISMAGAPLAFATTFLVTLYQQWQWWLATMIGAQLGWLNVPLPVWVPWLFSVALPTLALVDTDARFTLPRLRRLLCFCVAAGGGALVLILIYLFDGRINPVGADVILGVQGRYFIPLLPWALLALSSRSLALGETRQRGVVQLAVVSLALSGLAAAAFSVLDRYYG